MGLIKHILFHSFWAFLLVLSGIVDIIVSIVLYTIGGPSLINAPFPIFLIAFIVGMLYIGAGLTIAFFQLKRRRERGNGDNGNKSK